MTIRVPYVNARKTDPNVDGAYNPAEQLSHPTDHAQIIDTVRTGGHPRDDRAQLPGRVRPADAILDVLNRTRCPINSDSPACSAPHHQRNQASTRHEILVIKGRCGPRPNIR